MSRKRKRGKSSQKSASSSTSASSASDIESRADTSQEFDDASSSTKSQATVEAVDKPTITARKQRRAGKNRTQRAARNSTMDKNKGVRPWILPGFAGIAIIAIVLVGISALGSDDGSSAGANVPAPVLGEQTAQVVIHEYGDFQCPFCGVFSRSIKPQLKERFIDRGVVQLVWHDFAWHGRESRGAANAARCAGDQDRFWELHDLMFERQRGENQGTFSNDNLKRFGDVMGLEPEAFRSCVDGNNYSAAIDADMSRVRRLGLNGTPSFIIGDQRIIGAQPFEVFEQAVLNELQKQG